MRQLYISRLLLFAFGISTAFALTAPALAQPPTQQYQMAPNTIAPALDLKAHNTRTDRAAVSDISLMISSLDVKVHILGDLAETTITAQFSNPSGQILEGDFVLQLPREAWVTGFALDVNGTLIDGVLQPKIKAVEAYEENLRLGVDPGLGEVNDANQFRTRIFPINPNTGRTVKLTYVSTLDANNTYVLPLTTAGPIGKLDVAITTDRDAPPQITLPQDLQTSDNRGAAGETSTYQSQNVQIRGDLRITSKVNQNDVTVSMASNGQQYYTFIVPSAPVSAAQPKIVRVYWDASRSRRDDNLTQEIALLERYVREVSPEKVDLIVFADGTPRTTSFSRATTERLGAALRGARYQGASRFGGLEGATGAEADVCLLFSDGQLTLDTFSVSNWPCRVVSVSTSLNARRDILEGIAAANRGSFIDLKTTSISDALTALQARGPDLRNMSSQGGADLNFMVSAMGNGAYRVIGPKPNSDWLEVSTYGTPRRLNLRNAIIRNHAGAQTVWGVSEIKRLSATDNPDTDTLLSKVREFGVATPDYSYIVLETVADYARNNIAPSPSIGKEFIAAYQASRRAIDAAETAAKAARFSQISARWEEQKRWWNTRFNPQARSKVAGTSNMAHAAPTSAIANMAAHPPSAPAQPSEGAPNFAPAADQSPMPRNRQDTLNESRNVRSADARSDSENGNSNASRPASSITITTAPWNPDRPYLQALRDVKSGQAAAFDAVYTAQEATYGDTPAFYFDMAEWAFRNGFEARAASIARNALELSNTSVETKIILAGRLVRYGDFTCAIWLNERILQATPNKPQALHNLALSLIDATDAARQARSIQGPAAITIYERALDLLMKIVLTPTSGDYDGIELIALMEANHLVGKLKSLGVDDARMATLIPPDLIALLTVDIRVTMEWNTDKTDMDLWVDEPNGERAIYSNPRTAIGGRLSNDMTRGYGPEEYLLNVAPDGTYKVLSNAFAADVINPNGPTSLTVRLYRDWGRASEKVETFVVELNRGQQRATTEIGRFIKGPKQ